MRLHFCCALLVVTAVLAQASLFAAAPLPDENASPAELVKAALVAESAGDAALRKDLLNRALVRHPNSAPVRWQAGFVRVGNRWLSIEAAVTEAQRSGKAAKYRELRSQLPNTAAGHMQVAQWCADAELNEQERFHLICAMQSRPTKAEAQRIRKKLNLVRYQDTLVPAAQAESLKAEHSKSAELMQEWKPRLPGIQRDLEARDPAKQAAALAEIHAIEGSMAAVPLLDALLLRCKPATAQVVIRSLATIPDQAATDALVRYAVFAKDEEVRSAAAEGLRSRSVFSYVPTLLSGLESLVQVQYQTDYSGMQRRHRLSLFQEGPMVDQLLVSAGGSTTHMSVSAAGATPARITSQSDRTAARDIVEARKQLVANTARQQMNERIVAVLHTATGTNLEPQPSQWWSWWSDYNEMYQPEEKPVNCIYIDKIPLPMTFSVRMHSCFPAGTPVQTLIGEVSIEDIRPGDGVLSQDPETGELAYKPVLATTVRPLSPVISVRTENETIRATRGHPFWVSGLGWQMAKELKAGQWLHTTAGPLKIESAEQEGEAQCYNLVVVDFNSYFVGKSQVLVHDNNLRQVTTATVPGLTAE